MKILFNERKRLLLRLQRKPENISNLMENKFNVRAVSNDWKQYDDLVKLFSGVHNYFEENKELLSRKSRSYTKTKPPVLGLSLESLENLSRGKSLMKNNRSASIF